MNHDLPWFRLAYTVHSDITLTLAFFNNCNLANVSLIQFENKHLEVEAKHEMFRKKSFNNTPGRSVSLLTSVLNAQTALTGGDFRTCCAILLSYMQRIGDYLMALKHFEYPCFIGYKWPISS